MRVDALWRYPVKSMGGESITEAVVGSQGIQGDRSYAIHDGTSIRGAKKIGALMRYQASFTVAPSGDAIPPVSIRTPNTIISSQDPNINQVLSSELGLSVTLDQLRSAEELDYYRQTEERSIEDIRAMLGTLEDETFPDFSGFPPELGQYTSPPGTFFDAFPLLVLTSSALNRLQQAAPESVMDVRRFRPNIVLDTRELADDYLEESWAGRLLHVGEVTLKLVTPCPRCVMTTLGFDDLAADPRIMRTLIRENHHNLGIYADVISPGRITVNDTATLGTAT